MANRRHFTEDHKVRTVKEFQDSGLTARDFCDQRDLAVSTFSVWNRRLGPSSKAQLRPKTAHRKYAKRTPGVDFIPVSLIEAKPMSRTVPGLAQLDAQSSVAVEIVLPSGALIRLAANCPPSFLDSALAAMAVR